MMKRTAGILFLFLILGCGMIPGERISGYQSYTTAGVTVYYKFGAEPYLHPVELESCLAVIQKFTGLSYRKKIKIFLCSDMEETVKIYPFFRRNVSGYSLQSGRMIVLNYKTLSEYTTPDVIAGHELVHCLIYQNMPFIKRFFIPRWLNEGLAVEIAGPKILKTDDFREIYKETGCSIIKDKDRLILNPEPSEGKQRVYYNLDRMFVSYLYFRFGDMRFDQFLADVMRAPLKTDKIFKSVYGISLNEALADFGNRLFRIGDFQPDMTE